MSPNPTTQAALLKVETVIGDYERLERMGIGDPDLTVEAQIRELIEERDALRQANADLERMIDRLAQGRNRAHTEESPDA